VSDDNFAQQVRESLPSETARAVRWLGYATAALVLAVMLTAGLGWYFRQRDQNQRVKENAALIRQHEKTIEYLCETVNVMDLIIVQESLFLKRSTPEMGPNQRELLRERLATLETAHLELTQQRACESFR
jgi:hypothetical protein